MGVAAATPPPRAAGTIAVAGCLIAAALVALVGFAPSAWAEATIEVDVGYGGNASPGRPFPIRITVSSDELFVGELRVSDQSGAPVLRSQPIEIPAGTTREIVVVLEGNPYDVGAPKVELVDGDEVVATKTVRGRQTAGIDVVGVLPVLADRAMPESAPIAAAAGEARLFRIDPADLTLGWGLLGPLDAIVVTADDLDDLTDSALDSLLAWVNHGGRLLVDEPSGSPVPRLPSQWQPDGTHPATAGLGEVVLTDGNAAAGNWDLVFEPAPTRSRQEDEAFGELSQFWGGEPLSWGLGDDAGFALPSLRWLTIILAGYVAAAGPLLWFVLRRARRPGLAWVGVPLISLAFTGAIWVLGSNARNSTQTAYGTIVEVAPRGTTTTTYTLVHSKTGGSTGITLPEGWHLSTSVNEGVGAPLEVEQTASGIEASVDLDAGGFAVLGGSGTSPALDGTLTVTASSSAPGQVSGTVTNTLDVDLHEVVVFADQAGVNIGSVAAGATVDYDMTGQVANPQNGQPIEWKVWKNAVNPQFGGDGRPNPDFDPGVVNLGLWNELGARWSLNHRPVGLVMVAGWTDELVSPLDATVNAGRTVLLARSGIESGGGTVTDLSVGREVVRGSADLGPDFRLVNGWGGGAMVRFVLPAGAARDDLVLALPASQQRIDVWADGQWRSLDLEPGKKVVVALPDGAVVSDRVYMKILLNFERGLPLWRDVALRDARDNDAIVAPTWVTDEEGAAGATDQEAAE